MMPVRSAALVLLLLPAMAGCTGGSESNAAEEPRPARDTQETAASVDARRELSAISSAIPVYQGARFREDLTSRDAVMIRGRYGREAKVFTLATDDSFPQVYHYYTTYLAQFRAFPSPDTWPSGQQNWRTLEVPLTEAMQDPFIPGEALDPAGPKILLQVAETEAEPRTVIRYIVTPPTPQLTATEATFYGPPNPETPAPDVHGGATVAR